MKPTTRKILCAIGSRLRKLRLEKGESQLSLALKMNVAQSQVNRIESGRRCPSLITFIRFCKTLDVKPSDVLISLGL